MFCLAVFGCSGSTPTYDLDRTASDERSLDPGEKVHYRLELQQNDFIHIRVDQLGLDVELLWQHEDQSRIDHDYGNWVPEEFCALAERAGTYYLDVRASTENSAAGRYHLSVEAWRTAEDMDRGAAEGCELLRQASADRDLSGLGQVVDQLQGVDLPFLRTLARADLARGQHVAGAWQQARESWDLVIYQLRHEEYPALLGQALDGRGHALYQLQELDSARQAHLEAIELLHRAGDDRARATAEGNLAAVNDIQGYVALACRGYRQAWEFFAGSGDLKQAAKSERNYAHCLMKLGDMPKAMDHLESAKGVAESLSPPDQRIEASVLREIGWWHHLQQQPEEAAQFLEQSRELHEDSAVLDRLGTVYRQLGRFDAARRAYDRARADIPDDDRISAAHVAANICQLQAKQGDLDAYSLCRRALEDFRSLNAAGSEANILSVLASLEEQRGNIEQAHALAAQAVEKFDSQRQHVEIDDEKEIFLAGRIDSFQQLVDLRMSLHQQSPSEGWDFRALEAFDRMRARVLSEQLRKVWLSPEEPPEDNDQPFDFSLISRTFAPNTRLLVYNLGPETSYLWTFAGTSWQSFRLSFGLRELRTGVQEWLQTLQTQQRPNPDLKPNYGNDLAVNLSKNLFGPIAHELDDNRLLIIGEDILEQLPFGALPQPWREEQDRPLIVDHEIVMLPSLGVLQQIQQRPSSLSAKNLLAIVFDPVYSSHDERSTGFAEPAMPYLRLLDSEKEARAIERLAGAGKVTMIEGFGAQRERLLSGELSGYHIVHFATHAEAGALPGESTGLVLSQYTADGELVDNPMIALEDLYQNRLGLSAELVVLSACETALGETMRGEGNLSLARGFMIAGVPRVIMSLWQVPDGPTAELMERFYRGLLSDGLPPAAALRQAQVEMLQRSPREWAAFVLRGDWRSFPL